MPRDQKSRVAKGRWTVPVLSETGLIVVVDDDDSVREMLCELLEMAGFKAHGCSSGAEGLKAARELHPAAITLDIHMPGMDGVEVLDRLTDDEVTSSLPVVVVSAYAQDPRVKGRGQVKAIVQKPFDVEELFSKVRGAANGNG